MEVGRPATFLPSLGVAGAHEEPVRPGLKAGRVAELRKVPPDREQRLLRRILGEVEVAQDPARHGKVPIGDLGRKEGVRLLVTSLSSDHEIGIHASSARWHRFRPMLHTVWAGWADENFNLRAGQATPAKPSATPASVQTGDRLRFDLDRVDDRLRLGLSSAAVRHTRESVRSLLPSIRCLRVNPATE